MIKQRGKQINYKPFTTDGNTSVVMWDYKPILDSKGNETGLGTWMVECLKHKATIDDVKNLILGYYNDKIDEKILSGMVWKGMKVWLSTENQFNYKAAYDLAFQTNGANLPVMFKFGETNEPEYYRFESMEDLSDFYMSSMKYIQDTLGEGWILKDSINWEDYQ